MLNKKNRSLTAYEPWPAFNYDDFKATGYLLHRLTQVIGKLKLNCPFEHEWAHVVLYITSRGLTTGLIPSGLRAYSVEIDITHHQVICSSSWQMTSDFTLESMSVAELSEKVLHALHSIGVDISINPKPQEVPDPILFHEDTEKRDYDPLLATHWWQILVSSSVVFQRYHALFKGKTQPVGFMWGTFDLRDVCYGKTLPQQTSGPMSGYLRRNAMDSELIEAGFWSGNEAYPKPAYYSFTYPKPQEIENASIKPKTAYFDTKMGLFLLDYADLRRTKDPAEELFAFLRSTYEVGAKGLGWDDDLIGRGKPL